MCWLLITLSIAIILFLIWASANIRSGIYIKTINCANTPKKLVSITFDDGPDPTQTPKILKILEKHSAKATFFLIGKNVEQYPELTNEIVRHGHTIANHTYSHTAQYTIASETQVTNEICACSIAIKKATGLQTSLFRPPFGVTNPTIGRVVNKLHLTTIGWSIRTLDTINTNKHKSIIKRVTRSLHPGAIILLHDRLPQSDIILQTVLDEITHQEYTIVPLHELLNIKPYEN